jgi:hypothetical protein
MAARAFIVQLVRGDMKKILSLILLTIFTCSCEDFSLQNLKKSFSKNLESIAKKDREIVASEEFAQGSEDVPLLLGMEKIYEDSIGFDSNSGSIVSSTYTSDLDQKAVRDFYIKTLPQMGWKIVKNLETKVAFKRDKENLDIEFLKEGDKEVIRFFISSAL